MFKNKKSLLSFLLFTSYSFAEYSGLEINTVDTSTVQLNPSQNSNLITFPTNIMGTVFSTSELNNLKKRLDNAKKRYPIYADYFIQFGSWGFADAKLLAAIAITESNLCGNPAWRRASEPHYCGAKSSTGVSGLMQITGETRKDIRGRGAPYMRGIPTSDYDFFYSRTSIAGAAVALRFIKIDSQKHLNSNNARDYIRSYNAGAGCINWLMQNGKQKRNPGDWCTIKNKRKEAAQYPYIVAYFYYALGGKSSIFKEMLEGNDPFVQKTYGTNKGTGNFNVSGVDKNDTNIYYRPPSVCKNDTTSPLQDIKTLTINNTYGERYDHVLGKSRKNTFTQISAAKDTPVLAISKGTVLSSEQNNNGLGQVLKIRNEDGSVWVYATVKGIQVENGAIIEAGQHIAYVSADNKENIPLLTLGYFKDAKKSLSLEETNENFDDPLAHYCGDVDIPSDFTVDTESLSSIVTDVKIEQANSLIGSLESLINNRLNNTQWLTDISVMNEPRLHAELAYIKNIRMQIRLISQQIEDRTSVLKSAKVALLREKTLKDEVNQLNKSVRSER